ncbi:M56 family metallopeptidase [Ralstonia sp. A12]|uniref:M56 family metallopeptidase n=1 Tax=Ralstonia sp. A12 TaxID=1217052 RepID=UPI000694E9BC|nr:M56 family metallopeptidase [Ralstonia sp. A12]
MSTTPAIVVQALGWALLHFLWKGTLLSLAAALFLRLTRGSRPQIRYIVLCAALALCVLVPLIDGYREFTAMTAASVVIDPAQAVPVWLQQAAVPALSEAPMLWVVVAWLLGVGLMTVRVVVGLAWVHRLAHATQACTNDAWQACVSALAQRCGVRRPVRLRVVPCLSSPVTAGWWRPIVLVPASLLTQMPPDLIEALLAHEIAHIRRFDYLVNLLQRAIEALLFYHPGVWWLSGRIRVERELIADELAASLTGNARHLALALNQLSLLQTVETTPAGAALSARGGVLSERIRRLVRPQPQPAGWASVGFTATLGIALLVSAAVVPRYLDRAVAREIQSVSDDARHVLAHASAIGKVEALAGLIQSQHVYVVEDDSGKVLLRKDADRMVPIASLTKLMTAMVVLDAQPDLDRIVQIAPADAGTPELRRAGVPIGTRLPLRDVMQLALMSSDNRAAFALARTYPGGMPAFQRALQAKIAALGLQHTALNEPTGLSPHNRSTASDIATLAKAAADYPEIRRDTTYTRETVQINGQPVEYRNTNPLVGARGWDIQLSKTGFTDEAGRCLIMQIRSAGTSITMVLLNGHRAVTVPTMS